MAPGDLVFFNPGEFRVGLPGHVGIYLGHGVMVDAPHTGATVRVQAIAGLGPLLGVARPAAISPAAG
jgi:cell wall-associated NlpC family hydrolase